MSIINRASRTFAHVFVAGAPFQIGFAIGFQADEVIVRQISYGACTNDTGISVIKTDLIQGGDDIIGHVYANTSAVVVAGALTQVNTPAFMTVAPNSIFPVYGSKCNGTATFRIEAIVNNDPTNLEQNILADGVLQVTLEFVKYK